MNPQAPLGKGMMTAAWLVVLVMLTLVFGGFMEDQHNPNRNLTASSSQDSQPTILYRNQEGHYIANGTINQESVTFLLDTGATIVSIPESIADRLGLQRGSELQLQTANGTITTYATRLQQVTLGTIVQYDVLATINPYSDMDEILLGMSFLKHLEFTQRGNTLILRQ